MVPIGCCDMGYYRVHFLRMKVLEYIGRECGRGTEWADRYRQSLNDWRNSDTILEPLFKEMESHANSIYGTPLWERLVGAIAFCDHSDCDGDFYSEDCEYIAKALRATLDNVEMEHVTRDAMERLLAVFEGASEDGCRVEISRSRRTETDYGVTDMTDESNGYCPHEGMGKFRCEGCGGTLFTSYAQTCPADRRRKWTYEYTCLGCGMVMGMDYKEADRWPTAGSPTSSHAPSAALGGRIC